MPWSWVSNQCVKWLFYLHGHYMIVAEESDFTFLKYPRYFTNIYAYFWKAIFPLKSIQEDRCCLRMNPLLDFPILLLLVFNAHKVVQVLACIQGTLEDVRFFVCCKDGSWASSLKRGSHFHKCVWSWHSCEHMKCSWGIFISPSQILARTSWVFHIWPFSTYKNEYFLCSN